MKNFAALFALVFCGLAASWFCLLIVGAKTLGPGKLDSTLTVAGEDVVITGTEGLAAQGKQVYRDLGCATCHTQQVRRPDYGGDLDRGWGSRQSVARDYMLQETVILGARRQGPDLSNVGARHDAAWFFEHLYDPYIHAKASTMPSYPYLFHTKELVEGTATSDALDLQGNAAPRDGYEVVPTHRAIALVAYLQSLNLDYDLIESKRVK